MDYLAYLFLNKLIHVEETTQIVNGKEEVCLVIPTRTNQIKRGKTGNWVLCLVLRGREPNAKMASHRIKLGYLNRDEVQKAKSTGAYANSSSMGSVYPYNDAPELKVDRSNNSPDIIYRGRIILNDIPSELTFRNDEDGKRYVSNVIFKSNTKDNVIYSGFVCLDDIPRHHIHLDSESGKRYVDTVFRKLKALDVYMNTHQLIIATDDGSEIEFGRFKEWMKEGTAVDSPQNTSSAQEIDEIHTTTINPRPIPKSIDGVKF